MAFGDKSDHMDNLKGLLAPNYKTSQRLVKAFVDLTGNDRVEISYQQFATMIDAAETRLAALGVGKGTPVVAWGPNCPQLAATIIATFRLGALACPVDFRMTQKELLNVAQGLKAKVFAYHACLLKNEAEELAPFKDAGLKPMPIQDISPSKKDPAQDNEDLASTVAKIQALDLDTPALLILTSGTTGKPKCALHDLRTLMLNLTELGNLAHLATDMHILLPVPLSHVLGLEVMLAGLVFDTTILFTELSMEKIIQTAVKEKPEILVGVPTIYAVFLAAGLKHPQMQLDFARLLLCGGAPMPPSLAQDFKKRFNKKLNNGYGSTESKIIAVNLDAPPESVGELVPSCTVQIRDPAHDFAILPDGEIGEIFIGGPFLMSGYLDNPEATAKVLQDGFYRTGDLGYMKDGNLYISGRDKEMIIVAGNKVFPAEVEDCLRQFPETKEIAVMGVPNTKLGQIVKAHIVLKDGKTSEELKKASQDEEALKACKQQLTKLYKEFAAANLKRELRPMEYQFYPGDANLPKTLSGKIDKKNLH